MDINMLRAQVGDIVKRALEDQSNPFVLDRRPDAVTTMIMNVVSDMLAVEYTRGRDDGWDSAQEEYAAHNPNPF